MTSSIDSNAPLPKEAAQTAEKDTRIAGVSNAYRHYVLGALFVVFTFSQIDRLMMGVLAQPIKEEFGLSDSMLGLLTGPAFAVVYAALVIPLAMWADRHNRRNLIAVCLALWSAMTVLCGMVASAVQLLFARVGVAVGEAGASPAAQSMIADYYPPSQRSTALAVFHAGSSIGVLIGFTAGGIISEIYGWRTAFLAVGVPGVLAALILRLTVKEPRRGAADAQAPTLGDAPPLFESFGVIWRTPSARLLVLGSVSVGFMSYGYIAWLPSFYERVHDMSRDQIGPILGLIIGVGGSIGTILGGYIADRLGRIDQRYQLYLVAACLLIGLPAGWGAFWTDDATMSFVFIIFPAMIAIVHIGPALNLLQGLVRLRMRAVAIAVFIFLGNVVGGGGGPQFVGALSDVLNPAYGADSLRYSLFILAIFGMFAAVLFLFAARTLKQDLAAAAIVDGSSPSAPGST